jgi:hypothetical protein
MTAGRWRTWTEREPELAVGSGSFVEAHPPPALPDGPDRAARGSQPARQQHIHGGWFPRVARSITKV